MKRRTFVTATGATLTSIALAGCLGGGGQSDGDGGSDGETDTDTPADGGADMSSIDGTVGDDVSEHVEVAEHRVFQTVDGVGVTGVIENTAEKALESVGATVSLTDQNSIIGEYVDNAQEEIEYLLPGKRWRFRVVFEDEKLENLTGYTIELSATVADDFDIGGNETRTDNETTTTGNASTSD
jgi:hypothetical protein